MSMVCGLDLHRQQITFDAVETQSGEVWRGWVWQPDRARFRRWLSHDVARRSKGQPVAMAVEGCTGWRYVVEEIIAAGFEAHLAEPADTQAARGRKRHAKTDRSDARLLRELLQSGDLPESWIPPTAVVEWRERVRLYKSLVDQQRFGHRQPACRALVDANYGIGGLIAVAVWSELGDCHRFSRSEQVVRHTGLDVTVDASDRHRASGHLSRQGPPTLRWALFEAAMNASHQRSPDHSYYATVKDRHDGKLAAIAVARQFARRCYHILRHLDPDVIYAMPS